MLIQSSYLQPHFHKAAYALFCQHRERPWSYELFLKSVSNQFSLYAVVENKLLGYAIFTLVAGEGELEDICIDSEHRNKGIGFQLIEHFFQLHSSPQMDYLLLEVNENNLSAKHLYQKSGFKEVGKRKAYYVHNDGSASDALIMQKFTKAV